MDVAVSMRSDTGTIKVVAGFGASVQGAIIDNLATEAVNISSASSTAVLIAETGIGGRVMPISIRT